MDLSKTKNTVVYGPSDQLAIEEPLEIRLEYWAQGEPQAKTVSITMRSPGHDFELAAGFLFTEGIIQACEDIKQIRHCGPPVEGQNHQNIVRVEVHPTVIVNTNSMERNSIPHPVAGSVARRLSTPSRLIIHMGWRLRI